MRERLVSRVCLAAMFCLPVFANETKAPEAAREVSFRGGSARPGVYPAPSLRRLAGVAWKFRTEGPVRSSPSVSGGVVFFGSGDGRLYAIEEASGREIWRFQTGGAVDSSPAVSEGTVYVASRDRNLYAVDARSGKEKWRFSMNEDVAFDWGYEWFISSPAVDRRLVFVGGGDGMLSCLSADSGAVRWRFRTAGRIRSSPTVADGIVYQGSMDGFLYAVHASTGKLRWKYETEGARNDSKKAGFDRRSINSSASVSRGIVTFGSRDAHQYALDAKTGRLLWRIAHPVAFTKDHAELAWCEGSPAVSDGVSYVGSSDGYFVNAVEVRTGSEKWRTSFPSRVVSSPAVTGDTMYAGCEDGHLIALDTQSGRELWRYRTGDSIYSSPSADAGSVFIGSDDGSLYAFVAARRSSMLPWKAVYWDEKSSGHYFLGGAAIRDFLAAAGYGELDAASLPSFLAARAEDGVASSVVFASEALPAEVLDAAAGSVPLFRRYLDSGGRVVWPGGPPVAMKCDAKSGKITGYDPEGSLKILGVAAVASGSSGEELVSRPTPAGVEWGFPKWWLGALAAPSAEGLTVLGIDTNGKPSAWLRKFGERGEFVRFWGRRAPLADLDLVEGIAERDLEGEPSRLIGLRCP